MAFLLPFLIISFSFARETQICEATWADFKAREGRGRLTALQRVPSEEIKDVPIWEIQFLGEDIKYLTPEQFRSLTPEQIAALTDEQILSITRKQFQSLTIKQGLAFTSRQISILSKHRLFKFFPSEVDTAIIEHTVKGLTMEDWNRFFRLAHPI